MKKSTFVIGMVSIAFLAVVFVGLGGYAALRNPHTSDAEKFALSSANSESIQSSLAINASPKYKLCMTTPACVDFLQSPEFNNWVVAQGNLKGKVLQVFAADKADGAKWQMNPGAWDYVAVPPPVMGNYGPPQLPAPKDGYPVNAPDLDPAKNAPKPNAAPASTPVAKPATAPAKK